MIEPEMIEIPEDPFTMGTDGSEDEAPQQVIHLDRFEIAKHPVTNQSYESFLNDNSDQPAPEYWKGRTPPADLLNHPVVEVTWDDAQAYATWLSAKTGQTYRLPTEAEWEKAARGTDGRIYPWGAAFDASRCNTREEGPGHSTPVDYYPEGTSPYGVMDMAGNASEWCSDWYKEGYAEISSPNPTGPQIGEHRVTRGSSWRYSTNMARCAARYFCPPDMRRDNTGIRLVRI
ncbi:MAG TPA: formylglycine-generating enzyme family protein [Candidatus Latescibacteria bacterium]|nr:formylglycine-generating enzyme family protein [Candidatus Latescibacterota bacterium]